jgi:hypothetical protein
MPLPDLGDVEWGHLDWGSVPGWAGALSLLLAFRIFLRDRSNAERAQVDLIGAWGTTQYEIKWPNDPGRVETATARLFIRNASVLPVEVERLICKVETTWVVRISENRYDPVDGVKSQELFIEGIVVAPDRTWESPDDRFNLKAMAPESAVQLSPFQGVRCVVTTLWLIDNAGRRWELRPNKRGRARRVRWYRRPRKSPAGRLWNPGLPRVP